MHHYCTLFDSFYLSRGLAMHRSLSKSSESFHLYIFPFDTAAYKILDALRLDHVTLIGLEEFENEKLLAVKPLRSKAEYCWTCTPSVIDYCMDCFDLPSCTYLDADLFFFSDPTVLHQEMGNASVLITDHRYSKRYDQSKTSGIYCVQFITFRNDVPGRQVLHWWRDQCIEWCYDRFEDGKFGDQKYLDDWTTRFEGVHVLDHLGGGLAPWNVQRFSLKTIDQQIFVAPKDGDRMDRLVFFHFHALKFLNNGNVDMGAYDLKYDGVFELYSVYLKEMNLIDRLLMDRLEFAPRTQQYQAKRLLFGPLHRMVRRLLGVYNIYPLVNFDPHGATH